MDPSLSQIWEPLTGPNHQQLTINRIGAKQSRPAFQTLMRCLGKRESKAVHVQGPCCCALKSSTTRFAVSGLHRGVCFHVTSERLKAETWPRLDEMALHLHILLVQGPVVQGHPSAGLEASHLGAEQMSTTADPKSCPSLSSVKSTLNTALWHPAHAKISRLRWNCARFGVRPTGRSNLNAFESNTNTVRSFFEGVTHILSASPDCFRPLQLGHGLNETSGSWILRQAGPVPSGISKPLNPEDLEGIEGIVTVLVIASMRPRH